MLKDPNLNTAGWNKEDNFLISSDRDLGQMERIRIWKDVYGHDPTWWCRKVSVKNVKTGKVWYFFVERWLSQFEELASLAIDVPVATKEELWNSYHESTLWGHFLLQIKSHHIWVAPLFPSPRTSYRSPERLTVAMSTLSCYMFCLIVMYGLPEEVDNGILAELIFIMPHIYLKICMCKVKLLSLLDHLLYCRFVYLTHRIMNRALLAGLICLPLGMILSLLFKLIKKKKVPTLIVWRNKPGMEDYENPKSKISLAYAKGYSTKSASNDNARRTELTRSFKEPDIQNNKNDRLGSAFELKNVDSVESDYPITVARIPSTDIKVTEAWLKDSLAGTESLEDVNEEDLIHSFAEPAQKKVASKVISHGLVGGATLIKDEDPTHFVYKLPQDKLFNVGRQIQEDVRRYFDQISENKNIFPQDGAISSKNNVGHLEKGSTRIIFNQTEEIKDGKSNSDAESEESGKNADGEVKNGVHAYDGEILNTKKMYFQLCSMDIEESGRIFGPKFTVVAWAVNITVIVSLCTLTIMFGARYGCKKSYKWCAVLGWTLFESIVFLQPLKVIFVQMFTAWRIRNKVTNF